jgi:hypothetical protein
MRLALLLPTALLAALASPAAAIAQEYDHISFYLASSTSHVSNAARGTLDGNTYYLSGGGPDLAPEVYQSFLTSGIGFGMTVRLAHIGPTTLGLDLRGYDTPGQPSLGGAQGGFRLGYSRPTSRIKPYVAAEYGYTSLNTLNADPVYTSVNTSCFFCAVATTTGPSKFKPGYLGFQVLGGADIVLSPLLDFRVLEIGVGSARPSADDAKVTQNITSFTLSTGLVLHF